MQKRSVALVIHEGVQALDVVGPLDVFAEASGFLGGDGGYACQLVGASMKPVRASNGMALMPDLTFETADRRFNTALVAGGPSMLACRVDEARSAWLRNWAVQADRYGSICTGAFALGAAGLLDGRTVTTHWEIAPELAARFPAARVEHDRIYIRDGTLVTSAGVTAGIDLALALVSEDHGEALALACAKRLVVVAQRQGGQSQFSPLLTPRSDPATPTGKVQAHVIAHLREDLSVRRLAEIAGTSERTIARAFVAELGVTPHAYVENVRLDQARSLLEATGTALKTIAFDCGFASPEQMRATFQRRLGVSPVRYRESFRSERARDSSGA